MLLPQIYVQNEEGKLKSVISLILVVITKLKVNQIKKVNRERRSLGINESKDRMLGQYYLHAKQTYNGRPMKYPDTHFGHLSLYALRQEPFDGAFSASWRLEVNETIACGQTRGRFKG